MHGLQLSHATWHVLQLAFASDACLLCHQPHALTMSQRALLISVSHVAMKTPLILTDVEVLEYSIY